MLPSLFFLLWFFLLVLMEVVTSSKILMMHMCDSSSHEIALRNLARNLVHRGHEITIIYWKREPETIREPLTNVTDIELNIDNSNGWYGFVSKETGAFQVPFDVHWNWDFNDNPIFMLGNMPFSAFTLVNGHCVNLLHNTKLRRQLEDEDFDLAVIDLAHNMCSMGLAHHLGLPTVGYWPMTFSGMHPDFTTASQPWSIVPTAFSGLGIKLNFLSRCKNIFINVSVRLLTFLAMLVSDYHIQATVGGPFSVDLLGNLSGALINVNYAIDAPRLLPPNFINIAGLQIQPIKPLPERLRKWVDGSGKQGVVLFALSSFLNSKAVPLEFMDKVFSAMKRLNHHRFIVKYDGKMTSVIPSNVIVSGWVPQQDILAHPKTKLFFTHCGMHGVMEALRFAVPMVGMPVSMDQKEVLEKIVEKGIAAPLSKESTSEQIYRAMHMVLTNNTYKKNIDHLSYLAKPELFTALDRAMDLIEYIIDTKGAEHMKINSRNLNVFQYYCLDIAACVLVVAYIFYLVSNEAYYYFAYSVRTPSFRTLKTTAHAFLHRQCRSNQNHNHKNSFTKLD